MYQLRLLPACLATPVLLMCSLVAYGQTNTGVIRGSVSLKADNSLIHNATVRVVELQRNVQTDENGNYVVDKVPPGTYQLQAHMHSLRDESKSAVVTAGGTAQIDFALGLEALRQEVTVTASGTQESPLQTFQSVTSLEGYELQTKSNAPSLGEMLDNEPGIAKRSFGPGTSRPVVRGFDGDRVLVLQDGTRTGTLSSQSGDHGEPIDPNEVDRIEIVRGPATLLYGSSAIGGVVNVITRHHELHEHPHPGLHGTLNTSAGTTNGAAGVSGSLEYGIRDWLIWGGGGSNRTGDYHTPIGAIPNSGTHMDQGTFGFGHYSDRQSYTLNYDIESGRYGVPFSAQLGGELGGENVDLSWKRQHVRGLYTYRGIPHIDAFTATVNYTDWRHSELEGDTVGTRFFNKQMTYQGMFQQKPSGIYSGSFGVWGLRRDYKSIGEESLAPPVIQNAIAGFILQQFAFERFKVQLGGRLENNRYSPEGLPSRSFTGFSGSAGINVPLWKNGAFVANYTSSYRAPAIEELYNNGPHVGNLAFEVGNANLFRERGNGAEVSLRHQASRFKAEMNGYYYRFSDYVFLAATQAIMDSLRVARYLQDDVRYMGLEGKVEAMVNQNVSLNVGADIVNARVINNGVFLPRIPPLKGRLGADLHRGGFSLRPELVLANHQYKLYPGETPTAGYGLFNLAGSYTIARQHVMHVFSAYLFNATDQLYRNHLSFIKDLAPEIGRGVRVSYTLNFY